MRRWPRWSFAASAEKRSAKYAPHERERRRAGKCSSRGGGFAYCALDGMRRQLPRAPTPVPGLYPARYNLSPTNNSRSYNSRQGMPRQREQTPSIRIISALSETCQTSIYGLASRVILRGSKWNRHSRLSLPTSHYRKPARLQFMAGQVVWYCAAASGTGTAGTAGQICKR